MSHHWCLHILFSESSKMDSFEWSFRIDYVIESIIIVIVQNVWQMCGFNILISIETVTDCDKSKLLLFRIWNMFTFHMAQWELKYYRNGSNRRRIYPERKKKKMHSRQIRTREKDKITAAEKSSTKWNKIHGVIHHQSYFEFNSIFFFFSFLFLCYCIILPSDTLASHNNVKHNSVTVPKTHQNI